MLGDFDFRELGPTPQVWVLFQFDPNTTDQGHYFQVLGRLKPGITLEQADTRLNASAAEYRKKFPTALGPQSAFGVRPVREVIVGNDTRQSLLIYGGAVSFVLCHAHGHPQHFFLLKSPPPQRLEAERVLRHACCVLRLRLLRRSLGCRLQLYV